MSRASLEPTCSPAADPVADLRRLSTDELVKLGEDSLREHIAAQAVVAHHKHAPLTFARLDALLTDPECLRYPTRLVFEFGEMAMHQFAQPDLDHRNREQDGRVLYLRPLLRDRPDLARPRGRLHDPGDQLRRHRHRRTLSPLRRNAAGDDGGGVLPGDLPDGRSCRRGGGGETGSQ